MRRPPLASRIVALAFAAGAIVLAGCPTASDQPVNVPVPRTVEVETETVDTDGIEDEAPTGSAHDGTPRGFAEETPPSIGPGSSSEETAPAVTIERPKDFLRPTLPDAALRDQEEVEPADPPETITDPSAEAEDPNVLPGGTQIGDLFEGLEDTPNEEAKD